MKIDVGIVLSIDIILIFVFCGIAFSLALRTSFFCLGWCKATLFLTTTC